MRMRSSQTEDSSAGRARLAASEPRIAPARNPTANRPTPGSPALHSRASRAAERRAPAFVRDARRWRARMVPKYSGKNRSALPRQRPVGLCLHGFPSTAFTGLTRATLSSRGASSRGKRCRPCGPAKLSSMSERREPANETARFAALRVDVMLNACHVTPRRPRAPNAFCAIEVARRPAPCRPRKLVGARCARRSRATELPTSSPLALQRRSS